ncbi:MAG: nickel pincer cofactor biosynthesis protein LarB [Desulfocapsaceae bacterium]|jgi:NCAIR mutase (PurE)-related protein|nr:nickel pincer cofactor biosynthesis protein LarB [Desulfocapsaceae bacterium]
MNQKHIEDILVAIQSGTMSVPNALESLKNFPAQSIPEACIDQQRTLRTGIPEVIFGSSKTDRQIISIIKAMLEKPGPVIATRIDPEKAASVCREIPELHYHQQARILCCREMGIDMTAIRGEIVLVCAGTSDIFVAEEARVTAQSLGHPVTTLYDVGVAGLHRLLDKQVLLAHAPVIIVAAGMEGALPSVIAGLVSCPVIAVPTSVGYGAGIGGFAALLGMLNSCSPGVAVVNIDNGFGAACMAMAINRK